MRKLVLAVLALLVVVVSPGFARAQCSAVWTSVNGQPATWQSTQANPLKVSGTIDLGFTTNCTGDWKPIFFIGCDDSINPTCGAPWFDPFGGVGFEKIFQAPMVLHFPFDTTQIPNQLYDAGLNLADLNGNYIGGVDDDEKCVVNSFGRKDCDLVLNIQNGSPVPRATPTPTSACGSFAIATPAQGSTVAGPSTFKVSTPCSGWSFIRIEFQNWHTDWPVGTSAQAWDWTSFTNGTYKVWATLWSNAVTQVGTAPAVYFNVANGSSPPTPTPDPTPTPCSATCTGVAPTGTCTTNCACAAK